MFWLNQLIKIRIVQELGNLDRKKKKEKVDQKLMIKDRNEKIIVNFINFQILP